MRKCILIPALLLSLSSFAQDSLKVVEVIPNPEWKFSLSVGAFTDVPFKGINYYGIPFSKKHVYHGASKYSLMVLPSENIKTIFTTSGVRTMLSGYSQSLKNHLNIVINEKFEAISNKIDQTPCQVLLDKNSSCYKDLVNSIVAEIQRKYILTPRPSGGG
jgi:hypothetical protein